MRTIPFYEVWKGVVSRHGLDPDGDKIPWYTARAIVRAINRRTRLSWRAWNWPDFTITEERAYRTVWNATKQFRRVGANGLPDELFYIPNATYYQVNPAASSDPPVGLAPNDPTTGATYYTLLNPLDAYVPLDQVCKRSIARVINIFKINPRVDGFRSPVKYEITENGIDLFHIHGPTVFLRYLPTPSKFTIVPWAQGKAYKQANLIFYAETGECYISLADSNTQPPTDPSSWRWMPMPDVIANYVEAGAYADSLREMPPAEEKPLQQARIAAAQMAEEEAKEILQSEIDVYMAMGQRHFYQQHRPPRRSIRRELMENPAFDADSVTTLTDTCESDGSYPPPIIIPLVTKEYLETIVSLTGPEPSLKNAVSTISKGLNYLVEIVITVNTQQQDQTWKLVAGAYDSGDPGQVQPFDYDPVTNNKHWIRVG